MSDAGATSHARQLPLSGVQEDPWCVSRLVPGSAAYHHVVILDRSGPLDVEAFQQAFTELVRRHEAWRTTFPVVDGVAVQEVASSPLTEVTVVDLAGEPADSVGETATALATETIRSPYDLERAVPLRPLLIRLAEDRYRLYLAIHQLIFDGVAMTRVAIPELLALYDAFAAGTTPKLPSVRSQYGDYTRWERAWADARAGKQRLDYWRERLSGPRVPHLPLDRPRRAELRRRGGAVAVRVDVDAVARIRSFAGTAHTSLFQTVAAGFVLALHAYSGLDDISFGTVTDLRRRTDLEGVLGYCATPVPLRIDVSGDPTFRELVGRVRVETLDGYDNALPLNQLIRELRPSRDVGLNPLMQVMLVQEPSAAVPPGWDLEMANARIADDVGATTLDLQIEFEERPDSTLSGRAIYDADLFDRSTMEQLIERWLGLLDDAVRSPDRRISEFSIPSDPDPVGLRPDRDDAAAADPMAALVHAAIIDTAQRRPDAEAVTCAGRTLTYRDLMTAAQTIRDGLLAVGIRVGDVVGVIAHRSVDTVAAILGILSSGAAYVPLDPDDPPKRLSFILSDARAVALVTTREYDATLAGNEIDDTLPKVYIDEPNDASTPSQPAVTAMSADAPAYVLYTSGSTGQPKGVRVPHRAVTNLMVAMRQRPGVSAADVLLSVAAFTFDASVGDLFPTLGAGGKVVLARRSDMRDPAALARLIEFSGATAMQATPTTWQMLVASGWPGSKEFVARTGGEAISEDLAAALLERVRDVWNLYGPTETTVWATAGRLAPDEPVTVGTPLAGMRVHVLSADRPVPAGVVGEVCVSGSGVADGYVNRDAETAERFVQDPFAVGTRMYRTGDRGRLLTNGKLQILGRMDEQLKVRGIRIEPGEIEAALLRHPNISAAVVVLREFGPGDERLVAYVVGSSGVAPNTQELRAWLRSTLPGALIPAVVMPIEQLPVNRNGKLDRGALPAPPSDQGTESFAPPATALERDLARLWAAALGVVRVDPHADFFELGGHSLLAVQLLVQVETLLDRPIPVSWLFEARGSVAGLAKLITEGGPTEHGDADSTPAAASDTDRPYPRLILIWPNPGTLMAVRHMRTRLGTAGEISSFVPDYLGAASLSMSDLADRVFEQIRDIQAAGPYAIGGYSIGGALAYEVAGRLEAVGESVRYLAVIDAPTPKLANRSARLTARLGRFLGHDRDEQWTQMRRMVDRLPQPWRGQWRMAPPDWFSDEWPELVAAYQIRALGENVPGYTSRGHDVALDLFTSDASVQYFRDPLLGWPQTHRGPLRVHPVAGDHATMWKTPNVERLAALLVDQFRDATVPTNAARSPESVG